MAQPVPLAPTRPPFWNDPRVRSVFYQIIAVGLVLLVGGYLVKNTIENLQKLGRIYRIWVPFAAVRL